jgi:hypothetical protein
MSTAPTGERLPDYPDDDKAVTVQAVLDLLRRAAPLRWSDPTLATSGVIRPDSPVANERYDREIIADVLAAVQTAGDAQLVKNGTLRALMRDRSEIERLAAYLANHSWARELLEADGNPVDAAIGIAERPDIKDGMSEMTDAAPDPRQTPTLDHTDPGALLASAVARVGQADLVLAQQGSEFTPDDQVAYALFTAFVLAEVAEAAVATQRLQDEQVPPFDPDDFEDAPRPDAPRYVPQPVQGVRFTAELHPVDGQYMGLVGGSEWLHLSGHGFINIVTAEEVGPTGRNAYVLRGRIVSGTPEHILGITDGGVGVTLPRAMITEEPDE